jgi:hypothetical protein
VTKCSWEQLAGFRNLISSSFVLLIVAFESTNPAGDGLPFSQRRSVVGGNFRIAAGLLAVVWLATSWGGASAAQPKEAATCGDYGTNVRFEKTPSDAARKALQEEKLVLVLHVSGDFENPQFT